MGLLVASTATVGDIRTCTLLGGGLCTADPATDRKLSDVNVRMVLGPYPTQYEAELAFCDNIVPGSEFRAALSSMMMAQMAFDGENHGISNGPSCPPAPPAPATIPPSSPPPPTVSVPSATPTEEFEGCIIEGVVRDAGARPGALPESVGHPLKGTRVELVTSTNWEMKAVATDDDGRYSILVEEDDIRAAWFAFDPAVDTLHVRLRLEEFAHDPPLFVIEVQESVTSLLSDPFTLDAECDDGLAERDFLLGDIPADYVAEWPLAPGWKHIGEIYDRIHRGFELAELLKQRLDYNLPLTICTFCTGVYTDEADSAFWCGANSSGVHCERDDPFMAYGNATSLLSDWGWPDNRDYHEFGHHFMADSFTDTMPRLTANENHGGYYVNPTSADSWTEGFAEFFSMMVSKHIDHEPAPHLYRMASAPQNLELDYRAWQGYGLDEELAVAGLLLDLEDGPDDYGSGREDPNVRVAWHDVFDDPALGRLLVGEVVNNSPYPAPGEPIDYSEQTMVAAQFKYAEGQEVFVGWASTIPWDLPAAGGRGFFSIVLPADLVWDTVAVVAFEGRPGDVLTDDDPVDLSLQDIWDTIVLYTSLQPESNGHLFDMADLYEAIRGRFGGRDADGNGMDDIDQVFIAHGFFGDRDGNRSFRGETPGWTDHLGRWGFPDYIPRRDVEPIPGAMVEVDTGGVDARVHVQIALPEPNQFHGYSYVAVPDDDGRVHVSMPPPEYGGTASLTALADGYLPAVVGVIETETFWEEAEEAAWEPFLSFDVDMERGELGPSGEDDGGGFDIGWLLLAGGGGVLVLAGLASAAVARRSGGSA
jgi:hypothetical protein